MCNKYAHFGGEQNNTDHNILSTYFMAGTDVKILLALIDSHNNPVRNILLTYT